MDEEILIGALDKKPREQVRVYLGQFYGPRVDVRIWFQDGGEYCATKKGVTLPVGKLPQLMDLLQQAYARAIDEGMLSE